MSQVTGLNPFDLWGVEVDMGGFAAVVTTLTDDDAAAADEAALVDRAKSGDSHAFEQLYRMHRDRIYALVWRLCGADHALAEDLLQDAFVRAWQRLDSFRGDSQFLTWMHRLAVNVALSDRRSRLRKVQLEAPMSEPVERLAQGAADVVAGKRADLEAAIASLPERARTVLVLHDIEGYRHAEISRMAGMAVGSSKAQLHRARKLVREVLEK